MEERPVLAYAAEFIGTMLLVLFIGLVLAMNSGTGLQFIDWAVIGLLHAFILAMLIASLGGVSGAHFNPAVTVALAALKKIKPADAGVYIVLQVAGAIVGALIVKALLKDEGLASQYGATTVSENFLQGKALSGMFAELIAAFALMWAIMGTAVNPRGNATHAPWIIGGTLAAGVMCIGPLTGAGINPARAAGPSLVGDGAPFGEFLLAYGVGPIVGALLAAVLYNAIALRPERGAAPSAAPIDRLEA